MSVVKNVPLLETHIAALAVNNSLGMADLVPFCGMRGMGAVGESRVVHVGSVGCIGCRAGGYRNRHESLVRVIRFTYTN